MKQEKQLKQIRVLLLFFMAALFISGLTAIPVEAQLVPLLDNLESGSAGYLWVEKVLLAYREIAVKYPFLFYGYDWLAFAHFVLTLLFVGPYKDPVRNIWVLQFGLITCILVLPFALVAGYFRHIPFGWQLIDCSFGIGGFALLWLIYSRTKSLASVAAKRPHNIHATTQIQTA